MRDLRRGCGRLLLVGLICTLSFAVGCGRKAPPKPPAAKPLPVATDLTVKLDDGRVTLTWVLAPLGAYLAKEARFALYRDELPVSAGACPTCPARYQLVAQPPYDPDAPRTDLGLRFQYSETVAAGQVAAGYRYRYQVALRLADGRQGQPSTSVEVTLD